MASATAIGPLGTPLSTGISSPAIAGAQLGSLRAPRHPLVHHVTAAEGGHASTPLVPPRAHHALDPSSTSTAWAEDFGTFTRHPHGNGLLRHHADHHADHVAPGNLLSKHVHRPAWDVPGPAFPPLYGPTNGGFLAPAVAAAQRPAAEADFDLEMSRWMASHGDRGGEDVDAIMEALAHDLEKGRLAGVPELMPTKRPSIVGESEACTPTAPVSTVAHEPRIDVTGLERSDITPAAAGTVSTVANTPEVGGDFSEASAQQAPQPPPKPDGWGTKGESGVSEAARELLESVQHEQGDKWKNSQFLSLMRDFRDGKKDIVEDKICETSSITGSGRREALIDQVRPTPL